MFYLYNNGEVPLTYLKNIVSSSYTYYRVIQLFESDGIVKSRERIHNRKYILISLTDKGKWAVREYFSVPGDVDPGIYKEDLIMIENAIECVFGSIPTVYKNILIKKYKL